MTVITREDLREVLEHRTPLEFRPHARALVFLANTAEERNWMFDAVRDWAREDGFPLRLPHHSVSAAGLAGPRKRGQLHGSELDLAIGGILVLDEFADFDDHGLYNIRKRILAEHLPVVVIGLDSLEGRRQEDPDAFMQRLRDRAATVGIDVVTTDDIGAIDEAPSIDVRDALEQINRHRARMGMRPLDPVRAAWTEQDVVLEAERIARLPNPLIDLKRRLLQTRHSNPGYALEEYPVFPVTKWNQTYVFPLTEQDDALLRRVAREDDWRMRRMEGIGPYRFARLAYHVSAPDPIDDPPYQLVEVHGWRGWWAEPAMADPEGVVFWNFIEPDQTDKELERDMGRLLVVPSANPRRDPRRGRSRNPERWLAPKLSAPQRARLKQLHDVYFDLFEEIESAPGAAVRTTRGRYILPEGYALSYRIGEIDYVFFQDEAPAVTWSFVTLGREGKADVVEHLEDYLAVLERLNEAVSRQVRGQNPSNRVPRLKRA